MVSQKEQFSYPAMWPGLRPNEIFDLRFSLPLQSFHCHITLKINSIHARYAAVSKMHIHLLNRPQTIRLGVSQMVREMPKGLGRSRNLN